MQMLGKSDAVLIGFDVPDAADPADLARHSIDFWLTTEDLPLPSKQGDSRAGRRHPAQLHPDQPRGAPAPARKVHDPARHHAMPQRGVREPAVRGRSPGTGGVAHQNGTIRFGTDPTTSALDLDCKLHDLDNVYVPTPASSYPPRQ
jgi:choline dehydrogenase-like flavoprotein